MVRLAARLSLSLVPLREQALCKQYGACSISGFSYDFVRVFAFTQADELRVSQMIGTGPL
jgi:hypothetical protein